MTRTTRTLTLVLAALMLATIGLAGCAQSGKVVPDQPHAGTETPVSVKIGTLPTEDSLPLWVAQDRGYFAVEGVPKVEIVEFQSAQERDAAFASGAIDAYMGDLDNDGDTDFFAVIHSGITSPQKIERSAAAFLR